MEKRFYVFSESWYANTWPNDKTPGRKIDDIMISMDDCEFGIEWVELSGKIVCQLHVFDDAWIGLARCPELLPELAKLNARYDQPHATVAQVKTMLLALGYKDVTTRVQGA